MKTEKNTKLDFKDDFADNNKIPQVTFWNYQDNKVIIGYFKEWAKDMYGEHAILETEEGLVNLPNLSVLNNNLQRAIKYYETEKLKIKVTYLSERKNKEGVHYKDFEVIAKPIQ